MGQMFWMREFMTQSETFLSIVFHSFSLADDVLDDHKLDNS